LTGHLPTYATVSTGKSRIMRDVTAVQLLHNIITMLRIDVECVCSHSIAHQRVEAHRVRHAISCRVGRRKTVVYNWLFCVGYAKSSVRVGRHGRLPVYLYCWPTGRATCALPSL